MMHAHTESLRWTAAVLQSLADNTLSEGSTFTVGGVKKSLREVLDMADTALGAHPNPPAPGADQSQVEALREALQICVEHNLLHFGERHNTVIQGRAALAHPQPSGWRDIAQESTQDNVDECAEILTNLIANVEQDGLYSREAMLAFMGQALSCLKPANPAHPAEHQPENIRDAAPYNDPAFESLAREHAVWGTAQSALCAVFWNAAMREQQEGDATLDLEAAAKTLAERMDYPWESMPEKGRGHMRKHAQAVIDAAMTKGVDACEGEGRG